jgi:hypothetical protein
MNPSESITTRVKGILLSPKKEWEIISTEKKSTVVVFRNYVLPLSIITVACCFIGYGIIGSKQGMFGLVASTELGFRYAAFNFFRMITFPFVSAFFISLLSPLFNVQRTFAKTFSLVVYASTPLLIASIFFIIPAISFLVYLSGIYSLFLIYSGLKHITNVQGDKTIVFFIFLSISIIAVFIILSVIIKPIIFH